MKGIANLPAGFSWDLRNVSPLVCSDGFRHTLAADPQPGVAGQVAGHAYLLEVISGFVAEDDDEFLAEWQCINAYP